MNQIFVFKLSLFIQILLEFIYLISMGDPRLHTLVIFVKNMPYIVTVLDLKQFLHPAKKLRQTLNRTMLFLY